MEKKHIFFAILFVLGIMGFLGAFGLMSYNSMSPLNQPTHNSIGYSATVCSYKIPWEEDHYGERQLLGCSHNVLYNSGKNMTRDVLGQGLSSGAIINITLCNATIPNGACHTPTAAGTENFTSYTNCGMDGGTGGTYALIPPNPGNWSVYRTFTSTCDNIMTNATRLSNNSGSIFAGNTFTLATLQTNDQILINWTISVS